MPEVPSPSSIFDGIGRRQVGRADLVAHSVAMLTPSLTALGTGLLLPRIVGPGFWVSTLLGFGLAWLIVLVFDEFASRFSSAGSAYTYVAKGLGATAALAVGVALTMGYAALMGFGFSAAASRTLLAYEAAGGTTGSGLVWACLVLLGAGVCLLAIRRGIAWSTRATMTVEIVTVALLVVVLGLFLVRYGLPSAGVLSLDGASPSRVLAGVALIAGLTVAVESCATLGLEAERPLSAVPGSMRITLLITGSLFLAANLVGTVLPGADRSRWRWFDLTSTTSPLDAAVLAVLAVSMLALGLCAWTALSRLVFSFAREGLLPAALGRTDSRGVPFVATCWVAPIGLAVPLGSALLSAVFPTSQRATGVLLDAATVVMCVTYALVALALVPFLWRLDELRARSAVLAAITFASVVVVGAERGRTALDESSLHWALLGLAVGLGVLWRIAARFRVARVGAHDPTPAAAAITHLSKESHHGA